MVTLFTLFVWSDWFNAISPTEGKWVFETRWLRFWQSWSETCRNYCWLGTISTTSSWSGQSPSTEMFWFQDWEVCVGVYILELVESNRSAYARCWITCDVNRKQSIRGKYYRTRNGRKGLYIRKGKGDTCSQNRYSSNVTTVSATTNRQWRKCEWFSRYA